MKKIFFTIVILNSQSNFCAEIVDSNRPVNFSVMKVSESMDFIVADLETINSKLNNYEKQFILAAVDYAFFLKEKVSATEEMINHFIKIIQPFDTSDPLTKKLKMTADVLLISDGLTTSIGNNKISKNSEKNNLNLDESDDENELLSPRERFNNRLRTLLDTYFKPLMKNVFDKHNIDLNTLKKMITENIVIKER